MPPTYPFTDLANLGSILAAGELRCHSTADCSVDVADATIKSRHDPKDFIRSYPKHWGKVKIRGRRCSFASSAAA